MVGLGQASRLAACGAVAVVLLAGCSGASNPRFGGSYDDEGPGDDDYWESVNEPVPEPQPDWESPDREDTWPPGDGGGLDWTGGSTPVDVPMSGDWSCFLEPTIDYDWHDDVLCVNGDERVRPYLREWDSFVTEAEMIAEAREYEAYLNSGR